MISIIALVINLLGSVLTAAKQNGLAAEVVADLEAAVASLEKVQGTPVTFDQLESLRVKPTW
jgi:hypothetical protein